MDRDEKKRLQVEKNRYAKRMSEIKGAIEAEPKLLCTFTNLEFKGVDLTFTFNGLKYHLNDGEDVKLPISVIEHLNGLKVPVKRYKTDELTGNIKPETEVHQMLQRFSVTPKNLNAYMEALRKEEGEKEGE